MTDLIAIERNALQVVIDKIASLERKLDQLDIRPMPAWVPVAEYARMKGVHPRTVKRRIDEGSLQARGAGKMREVKVG